ncbi:hypothetical protein ACMBCM_00180 [Spiroplasma sp. K1]
MVPIGQFLINSKLIFLPSIVISIVVAEILLFQIFKILSNISLLTTSLILSKYQFSLNLLFSS